MTMQMIKITSLLLLCSLSGFAQVKVAIGKTTVDGDAMLDFGSEVRGLVLAPVANVTTMTASPGTIAFDGNTGSFRYLDNTGVWSPVIAGGVTGGVQSGTDGAQFLIGTTTASSSAVLHLGANSGESRALVLPKLANGNLRFNNPVAGLMYYDTVLKAVMVYNGAVWTAF